MRLFAFAVATMSSACSAVIARGFSQKTCLPALSAATAIGWCRAFGVAMLMMSIVGSSTKSCHSVAVVSTSNSSARAARRSCSFPAIAARTVCGCWWKAFMCAVPMPSPTTPALNFGASAVKIRSLELVVFNVSMLERLLGNAFHHTNRAVFCPKVFYFLCQALLMYDVMNERLYLQ